MDVSEEEAQEFQRRGDATRASIKERIEAKVAAQRAQLEEDQRTRAAQERQCRRRRTR